MTYATCGNCRRSWDDSIVTSMTPAPSARCPFEGFHDGEPIPADWPVQPVVLCYWDPCWEPATNSYGELRLCRRHREVFPR